MGMLAAVSQDLLIDGTMLFGFDVTPTTAHFPFGIVDKTELRQFVRRKSSPSLLLLS